MLWKACVHRKVPEPQRSQRSSVRVPSASSAYVFRRIASETATPPTPARAADSAATARTPNSSASAPWLGRLRSTDTFHSRRGLGNRSTETGSSSGICAARLAAANASSMPPSSSTRPRSSAWRPVHTRPSATAAAASSAEPARRRHLGDEVAVERIRLGVDARAALVVERHVVGVAAPRCDRG